MKKGRRLIMAVVIAILAILGGLWLYFGWWRGESQVVARCHKKYVVPQGDYYRARDDFYQCLKNQGGIKGFYGDGRFQWDKKTP